MVRLLIRFSLFSLFDHYQPIKFVRPFVSMVTVASKGCIPQSSEQRIVKLKVFGIFWMLLAN